MNASRLVLAALLASSALGTAAQAQAFGTHPAMRPVTAAAPQIDPNTFIVAHPAGLALRAGHANHEHPAVTIAREAGHGSIDPNQFIVQPPASVRWALAPEAPVSVAAAR